MSFRRTSTKLRIRGKRLIARGRTNDLGVLDRLAKTCVPFNLYNYATKSGVSGSAAAAWAWAGVGLSTVHR